ncbi:copper amine oxidase N-terminal domain-containing protein [Brevibacillus ruminantium]|uniref:Copper amine oxidase N-terminal domain-containing protein n=1 Tax=Brevibacillus ruminantium TaxID=2950604 RepID=A0ABY4WGF2_9BACL|nr:copper amine oxidase N-terminal domain-containing protein [Brevibacillus ruminantium]USG66238.1 copper amine oxidase N-terminal domain-containing protein [Brevibacillus ruminantium]
MKKMKYASLTLMTAAILSANITGASATSEPVRELSIQVNGQQLELHAIDDKQQQTVLVPLRQVAEALGYEVSWNSTNKAAEVKKGAQWSYAKAGEDNYPYAKMYKSVGAVPKVINDKTYVTVAFVQDILQTPVQVSGDSVSIADQAEQEGVKKAGSITRINRVDGKVSILVNGYQKGILLHIGDETKIVKADGKPGTVEDLKLGTEIEAVHANFMALSLPPQTSAKEIVIKNSLETPEVLGTFGTVQSVEKSTDGNVLIGVKGERLTDNSFEEIRLVVTDETKVLTTDGKTLTKADVKPDMKVFAYYSPKLTRSLIPQGVAEKIVVEPAEELAAE